MIKRTLLLLLFPLLMFTSRIAAQNTALYELTVKCDIMGFGDNAACGSLYEAYAIMQYGGSRLISSSYLDGIKNGEVWYFSPKTITFTADNPVIGIAIFSKRRISCNKTADEGERDYFFPAGDRTCFNTQVGGYFAGYNDQSTLHVSIKPVSNVYELKLETTEVYPLGLELDYDVSVHYTDGTTDQKVLQFISTAIPAEGDVINRTASVMHSTPKKIASVEVNSEGTKTIFLPITTKRNETFNVSHTGVTFDGWINNPFVTTMNAESKIHVTYNQVNNDIVYGGQGSYILPTEDFITLTGPSGIPTSQYKWYYQVEGTTSWEHIADNVNPLRISGQSLFGANWTQHLNKLIRVKMVPACAGDRESSTATLSYRLQSPRIKNVYPKSISCNGANDGGFTLEFDRALYPGETLNVEVKDLVHDIGGTLPNQIGITMGPGNTYTWPTNTIHASNFQVKATGGFINNPTYSDSSKSTFQLPEPTPVVFSTPAPIDVKCFGGSDGGISLNVSGGAGGYVGYYKSTSDIDYLTLPFNQNAMTGLPIGDYLIKVKDQNGCPGKTATGDEEISFTVKQPDAPLVVDAYSTIEPKAFGYSDGSITVHLRGGTPNADGSYTVEWKKADGTVLTPVNTVDGNGIYTTTISNQPDGDYILTVTDANYNAAATNSRNGCSYINTFKLTQPPLLVANIQIADSISCTGKIDGTLTAIVTGGVPFRNEPYYTYEWYQIANGMTVPIGQTDSTAVGLPAGQYLVKATDANGIITWSDTTDLIDPAPLQLLFNTTPATCYDGNNGALEALVSGGTSPYYYNWSNGSQAAHNTGLHAGMYTVDIKDYHGCPISGDSAVAQPAAPIQIAKKLLTEPLAYGYSDGSIKILLQGGTANPDGSYNVSWKRADGTALGNGTGQVVADGYENVLSDIPAGDYIVTITDTQFTTDADPNMQGCMLTVPLKLDQPAPLQVTVSEQRYVSCKGAADGVLFADAKGGVQIYGALPYRFTWYKLENGNYNTIPQTTPTPGGLTTGTYKVKITDANNIDKTSDPFLLVEPNLLQVQLATTPVTCASGEDGAVNTTVTGGTGPYNYEWTNGATTANISKLPEGSYLVFVTDARGCEAQNNADVFIPNGIVINAAITSPVCAGSCNGAISAQVSGGIPPYRYEWSNGATTGRIANLCAGKYTLTIQDANNCKRVQTFNLPDPAPLQVQLGSDKTLCTDQTYTVNAAVADPAATYTWGGQPAFQATTPQVTLSKTGQYWVSVTDGKGCIGRDTIRIEQRTVDISAEFVMSTQVFRNEEVSLINISTPMPERTVWEIPDNKNITVLQNTPLLAGLRFADTGVYRITLHSYIGDCEKVFTKDIAVLESQSLPTPGGAAQQPFITSFEVSPNPNNGQFNVRVTLDKPAEIRLRLFNIISNQLVNDRKESASEQFNLGYQLNMTAGTYVLLLETPLGNAIRKIIITQ